MNASVRSETPPSLKLLLRQEKKKMKLEVRATTSSCTTSPNQIRENANPRRAAVLCGNKVGNSKATDCTFTIITWKLYESKVESFYYIKLYSHLSQTSSI